MCTACNFFTFLKKGVDERLFFAYSVLNTAATPLHNAQPWRLFYARILELPN